MNLEADFVLEVERVGNRAERALELLQVLADHHGVRLDRAQLLQSLQSQSFLDDDELWIWLSRSATRVGLRLGGLDCSYNDIVAFARGGYPLVFSRLMQSTQDRENGEHQWLIVTSYRRGRFACTELGATVRSTSLSGRALSRWLGQKDRQGRWRCLTSQVIGASGAEGEPSDKKALHPLRQLRQMIAPDRADIVSMFVFSLVVGVLTLAAPLAVEALVNTVAFGRYLQPVFVLSLALLIFLGFAAALRLLLAIVSELLQRRLFARVAEDLGYRLPRVATSITDREYGPELVNRFLDIANIQKTLSSLLLDGLSLVVSAAVGMIVLAFYHPFLLGFDLVLVALMAFAVTVLGRGAIATSKKESKAKYKLTAWFEDLMRNPTAFSFHGGQRFALERSDMLAVEYLDLRRSHFAVLLRQIGFALFTYAAALTALLGLGGWLVIRGELTLGQLVAAELIVSVVVGAFAKMGKHMESYYDMLASADKVGLLLNLPLEENGGILELDGVGPTRLEVRNLQVKAGDRKLLTGFSGEAVVGGFTAIVGPAGSGKSLLVETLVGKRQPAKGSVLIDGNLLDQLDSESLRQQIGIARDVEVFHGTIAENVHLYRPNIRSNDVRDALEKVGLLNEFRSLEEGVDTMLSSDARPLSRDQALRLMLARAIVGRPRMLVIDGTLDGLSDESLWRCLERICTNPQPWTCVIASGRQVIRQRADTVWNLAKLEVTSEREVR